MQRSRFQEVKAAFNCQSLHKRHARARNDVIVPTRHILQNRIGNLRAGQGKVMWPKKVVCDQVRKIRSCQ